MKKIGWFIGGFLGLVGVAAMISSGRMNGIVLIPTVTTNPNQMSKSTVSVTDDTEETAQEPETIEMTKSELLDRAEKLDYKKAMRNPEDYLGNIYYADVDIFEMNSEYTEARVIHFDDDFNQYVYESYENYIYINDVRDKDSDDYFKIMENDSLKIYGKFADARQLPNGNEYMVFDLFYAELLEE